MLTSAARTANGAYAGILQSVSVSVSTAFRLRNATNKHDVHLKGRARARYAR